jgi:hypothetical protein
MLASAASVFAFASRVLLFAALVLPWAANPAPAAEPIKVGLSMALTGGVAPIGKQLLLGVHPHNLRHAPRIDGGVETWRGFPNCCLAWRGCQCSCEKAT